jgi:hypothetical protein
LTTWEEEEGQAMRYRIISPHLIIKTGIALLVLVTFPFEQSCYANDSAAEIATGGIQFKEEKNISIEREELSISKKRIEVNYLFRNHSKTDISTEIAFPIPQYEYSFDRVIPDFDDFIVEVNGQRVKYKKEIRAFVGGKDYTKLLEGMNVSISDFGKFDPQKKPYYISKLSEKDRATLIKLRIADTAPEIGWPLWSVSMKYHWTQKFPASETVSIRHTYTPYYGYKPIEYDLKSNETVLFLKEACIDRNTIEWIKENSVRREENYFYPVWVSYILTTANNWRKPIKSFNLTVHNSENERSSFCFDHKITKSSPARHEVYIRDYVPSSNLQVYFFEKMVDTRK